MENLWGIRIPDYYHYACDCTHAPFRFVCTYCQKHWLLGDQNERFLEILYFSLAASSDRIYGRILRSQEIP